MLIHWRLDPPSSLCVVCVSDRCADSLEVGYWSDGNASCYVSIQLSVTITGAMGMHLAMCLSN